MEESSWAGIGVAVIGLVSAWLAARSARKAAEYSSNASISNSKVQAETDAYNRARKMDLKTIQRQGREIEELVTDKEAIEERFEKLQTDHYKLREISRQQQEEIQTLKRHVARLTAEIERYKHE